MNCCRETAKMVLPPGNRPAVARDWFRGVPKRYVAGANSRGRQEGRPYPWSQQVIHEISGLKVTRTSSQDSGAFLPALQLVSRRVLLAEVVVGARPQISPYRRANRVAFG